MTTQTRISAAVACVVALAVALAAVLLGRGSAEPRAVKGTEQESLLLRNDSHVLGETGSSDVTVVEFLDFECEACRAAFPIVEQLREQYAGKVTFVIRFFPLGGHFNAERAARAVESASRQGKLEEMYARMYETQASWGEAQTPQDKVFRNLAIDLDLDMAQFDRDYASTSVKDRVQRDLDDAEELGLQGTPSFFVDGEPLQPQSTQDFVDAIDAALGR